MQVPIGGEEAATELAVIGTPRDFDFEIRYYTRNYNAFSHAA